MWRAEFRIASVPCRAPGSPMLRAASPHHLGWLPEATEFWPRGSNDTQVTAVPERILPVRQLQRIRAWLETRPAPSAQLQLLCRYAIAEASVPPGPAENSKG